MQYRQEYYKGEAEDNGEILSTHEMAEMPYGQFDNALLTKDTITIEPERTGVQALLAAASARARRRRLGRTR